MAAHPIKLGIIIVRSNLGLFWATAAFVIQHMISSDVSLCEYFICWEFPASSTSVSQGVFVLYDFLECSVGLRFHFIQSASSWWVHVHLTDAGDVVTLIVHRLIVVDGCGRADISLVSSISQKLPQVALLNKIIKITSGCTLSIFPSS